jgi:II/X family phage/plasmid replication protein
LAAFVDWLTGVLPFEHPLPEIADGAWVELTREGAVKRMSLKRLEVRGSWDSRMFVRSGAGGLEFSGNPAKFLQGHNLWGPEPEPGLGGVLGLVLTNALGFDPTMRDLNAWDRGEISLTRIDITRMVRPEWAAPGWVRTWLTVAAALGHGGHQKIENASAYDASTLYVGKHSKRISLKIYDKAAELRKHPQPILDQAPYAGSFGLYSKEAIRIEVTLRGMELRKRGLERLAYWSVDQADGIIDERLGKLSLPGSMGMAPSLPESVRPALRQAYRLWFEGNELRDLYPKATFYKLRKELLAYEVDIAKTRPRVVREELPELFGRPLKDFISGPGLERPEWAEFEWLEAIE